MNEQMIKARLHKLPEDLKREVLDYIEFLLQKSSKKRNAERFKFDWEGGLSELKDTYTSVQLQHKALDWR